jgi:class 3 adenylate cyclase
MADSSERTLVCSVLFLDIVGYSKEAVAEQAQLKRMLDGLLVAALERVAPRDRIILDTGDGAAITFFGDPENALSVAVAIRDALGGLPVRMGINLGPVRLINDLNGQTNVIGDGINVAQRVMSFSRPGQLLVSRSYYDVVSCLSSEYQTAFSSEGSRRDKHVRAHDVYSFVPGARVGFRGKTQPLAIPQPGTAPAADDPDEDDADGAAQVFDAGPNLIVSGYSKASVETELARLVESGARLISPISKVGKKWVVACEHPHHGVSACKVEKMGSTHIITGPTREAVAAKVDELIQFGAVLVGNIEQTGSVWTAVCDAGNVR